MMKYFKFKRSKWLLSVSCLLLTPVLYLLSYAPHLRVCGDKGFSLYRSPEFYRAAEWVMLKTHKSGVFTLWNEAFGVEGAVDLQLWFFAQGLDDPEFDLWINFQES